MKHVSCADVVRAKNAPKKVLATRMGVRDPGNQPMNGDRIPYVYIVPPPSSAKKILQGDRIEHPAYVKKMGLTIDFNFYIQHQIMKPVLQIYALVVESLEGYGRPPGHFAELEAKLTVTLGDPKKVADKISALREACAEQILFSPTIRYVGWIFFSRVRLFIIYCACVQPPRMQDQGQPRDL